MIHPKPERIRIAKITTAHGVKGFVKLKVDAENSEIIQSIPLFTSADGEKTLSITLKNQIGRDWVASIHGVTDRSAAEALRHTVLWIDKKALPEPDEGEYFIADLVGLTAVDASGKTVGTVKAVEDFGATPLLDIKPEKGASFYLPFTDECVPSIDFSGKKITVSIPEGLL